MDRVRNFTQAYSQTPWRKQVQVIGLFLLLLVFLALVAGIYLNVTARTATLGREIQGLQAELEQLDRDKADLQSKLAFLTSSGEMEKRARSMGFDQVEMDESIFLLVPGYSERRPAILAPSSQQEVVAAPVLPSEYSESLFQWLRRQIAQSSLSLSEVKP